MRPRLLDTSVVSLYIAPDALQKTPNLVQRVNEAAAIDGARISFVTFYEIDRGLAKARIAEPR
jgi:PIN domain nuclease of toxin-antitoxin system